MSDRRRTLSPLFTWRSAIASPESGLAPSARLLALVLSLHMSERGDSCFPSIPLLTTETGLSRRCVIDQLAVLEERGWLEIERGGSPKGKKRRSNRYRAKVPTSYDQCTDWTSARAAPVQEMQSTSAPAAPESVRRASRINTSPTRALRMRELQAALTEATGIKPETRHEKSRFTANLRTLARAGATPEEIAARARRWHRKYSVPLTDRALVNHWGELAGNAGKAPDPPCPECGIGSGHHLEGCLRA